MDSHHRTDDHWVYQGRQYHMWFGHGTAPGQEEDAADDPSVTDMGLAERMLALAHGAIAALPAAARRQAEAQYHAGTLPHLIEAMTAWVRGSGLDQASFAERFFARASDDSVVRIL
jgi:hypothetical protein